MFDVMTFIQLSYIGIINGMIYALIGFAFVSIFRVTRIVNLALGEFFMIGGIGALIASGYGLAWPVGIAIGVGLAWLVGQLLYATALQPAQDRSTIETLILITVGASLALRGLAQMFIGSEPLPVSSFTSDVPLNIFGIAASPQAFWVLCLGSIVMVILWFYYQYTAAGLSLNACADDMIGAAISGINPQRNYRKAFVLGCVIAGFAGTIATPITFVSFNVGLFLGFKGFTAAVVGGLRSFYGTALGALLIGLLESYSSGYVSSGYRNAITFVVLIVVVVLRKGRRPMTSQQQNTKVSEVAPDSTLTESRTGGRSRRIGFVVFAVGIAITPLLVARSTLGLLVVAGAFALAAVGVGLLLGFTGQITIGHAALMGIGGYATAILTVKFGVNSVMSLLIGVLVAGLVSGLLSKIIFRLNGLYLAMATLGLGIVFTVVITQARRFAGGAGGISGIGPLAVGLVDIQSTASSYYAIWFLVLSAMALSWNLISCRFGRSMRAIKSDEEAAISLGVDSAQVKSRVFVFSALLAAIAGSMFAHYMRIVAPSQFSFEQSVELLIMSAVGGMGSVWGGPLGAIFTQGLPAFAERIISLEHAGQVRQVIFGLLLIVVVVWQPRGLVGVVQSLGSFVKIGLTSAFLPRAKRTREQHEPSVEAGSAGYRLDALAPVGHRGPDDRRQGLSELASLMSSSRESEQPHRGTRAILEVRSVSKSFGGLQALNDVTMTVASGEICGLIGPNGAGKTTLFNCVTGRTVPDRGIVHHYLQHSTDDSGVPVSQLRAHELAGVGVVRTFQNVRLFDNMTVAENIMVGAHSVTRSGMVDGMLKTRRGLEEEGQTVDTVDALLEICGLSEYKKRRADSLPFGYQRVLEIARALAARPRIILLDEPAAGLNETEKNDLSDLLLSVRDAGISLLLVEHDMGVVMNLCERIYVLDHGVIIAHGEPHEIRDSKTVQAAYLGIE